jgi:hypothetical protein
MQLRTRIPAPAKTIPAPIVFRASHSRIEPDGTERMVFRARILGDKVVDTKMAGEWDRKHGYAYEVESRWAGQLGTIALFEVVIKPDGDRQAKGWIQGGDCGGRRHNLWATGPEAIADVQEHVMKWAARRFRLPVEEATAVTQ